MALTKEHSLAKDVEEKKKISTSGNRHDLGNLTSCQTTPSGCCQITGHRKEAVHRAPTERGEEAGVITARVNYSSVCDGVRVYCIAQNHQDLVALKYAEIGESQQEEIYTIITRQLNAKHWQI